MPEKTVGIPMWLSRLIDDYEKRLEELHIREAELRRVFDLTVRTAADMIGVKPGWSYKGSERVFVTEEDKNAGSPDE